MSESTAPAPEAAPEPAPVEWEAALMAPIIDMPTTPRPYVPALPGSAAHAAAERERATKAAYATAAALMDEAAAVRSWWQR